MNKNFKPNEKELLRLINFFKKRADTLMKEGKLGDDHEKVIAACEKLMETLTAHVTNRTEVLLQREFLENLIKDNAECPKCHKNAHIKLRGIDKNEKGWKCNKYRCKRCNIEFVWSRPNNPWDMIPFIEISIHEMELKLQQEKTAENKTPFTEMIEQMKANLAKLKPVIETFDATYEEMQTRDLGIEKMIHEFKNHLLIEKIKMDAWNPNASL